MSGAYMAKPISRRRATKGEMLGRRAALSNIVWAMQPMTVRSPSFFLSAPGDGAPDDIRLPARGGDDLLNRCALGRAKQLDEVRLLHAGAGLALLRRGRRPPPCRPKATPSSGLACPNGGRRGGERGEHG